MTTPRRALLAAPALLLAPRTLRAQSQDWPTRPVTMLIPFVAGGPSDITGRLIAARAGAALGQPMVAENQALRPNLGYDALRDFAPVTLAVTTPNVLVANPQRMPATDVPGTLAWLRENGARASYSTSGVGSSEHLTMELFKLRTNTEATHVPYQGGAAAATALIAGDVQLTFQNLGTVAPHIAAGRLRPILVTSARRHPTIPEVPTAIEAGLSEFVVTSWQAVMAPAAVPAPILARLETICREALQHPESVQRLSAIGFDVVASSAAEFRRFQEAEVARWRHRAARSAQTLDSGQGRAVRPRLGPAWRRSAA
jgi:tripartite-type tricarboxylate transporter receptor subunit TctC